MQPRSGVAQQPPEPSWHGGTGPLLPATLLSRGSRRLCLGPWLMADCWEGSWAPSLQDHR